jgi:hypothetical protein
MQRCFITINIIHSYYTETEMCHIRYRYTREHLKMRKGGPV